MAFPIVAATNQGKTANGISHTVNLPANVSAGDLLVVVFTCDGNPTIGYPEGWTLLFNEPSVYFVLDVVYKIADGEEGASITVTTSAYEPTEYISYRITGCSGNVEAGTAVTMTTVNQYPDPPNLTPTWGAKDTLWLPVCVTQSYLAYVDTYPENYENGINLVEGTSSGNGVASAQRELNAESEDPGVFTLTTATRWAVNTVAIEPTEATGDFTYTGTGSFAYSGTATQTHTRYYLTTASGELIYLGAAICEYTIAGEYIGSGTFIWSGSAVYSYTKVKWVKIDKETGDWIKVDKDKDDWTKVNKEKEDFTKVTKEKDDWDKVNKDKDDWKKAEKE